MIEKKSAGMKSCLACGELLPRGHGYKIDRKYCDIKCYENRHMIALEREHGKPIKEIVLESLNETKNVTMSSDMLGITKQVMYRWLEKMNIKKVIYWE